VALMTGCAQRALNTDINDATIRLLTRHGCEVVVAEGAWAAAARSPITWARPRKATPRRRRTSAPGTREMDGEGLDAIVINTSGCGTTVKDYGHMFRTEPLAEDAARVSAIAKDISEVMVDLGLGEPTHAEPPLRVAYHAACSLQHGQQIKTHPKTLLKGGLHRGGAAGPHLCCGSAGTYNLMQPEISAQLKARKVKTSRRLRPT
jgi:glycolate oxidase iron-sulfur subunit